MFRVDSEPKSLVFDVDRSTQKFEILQKTQLALLKSYFVLQTAVRDPSIASLSIFAGEGDPVQWLQENLAVDFPQQSEILSISLSGDDPSEDQRKVVDAVAKAYEDEVLYGDKTRRLVMRDALARSLDKVNDELNRKMEEFYNIARELGQSQATNRDPEIGSVVERSRRHAEEEVGPGKPDDCDAQPNSRCISSEWTTRA